MLLSHNVIMVIVRKTITALVSVNNHKTSLLNKSIVTSISFVIIRPNSKLGQRRIK